MTRLWDKGENVDALVHAFTVGDDHRRDERLVAHDIRASQAHAEMLGTRGYLRPDEVAALDAALAAIGAEHAAGAWTISREEEDCHTAIENRLVARLGVLGGKVHLGRSRNDQVLAALRLYLKAAIAELGEGARAVVAALEGLATRHGEQALPGYTHMQRAMPSSVALWARGYAAELADDAEGLAAAVRRVDRNPLGSAAGYGVPVLTLDRQQTTRALGFAAPHDPVTAVQLSRGKAEATLVFELCLLTGDLGRLASELVLFATAEFGFFRLPAAFTTGSSIMPQKRNPDVFELVRAHAVRMPARLQAILALTAKLPSGYHRDLQLIKGELFDAIDSARDLLAVMAHAIPELEPVPERIAAAMDPTLDATAAAYRLVVDQGLAFRDAYRQVAAALKPPAG